MIACQQRRAGVSTAAHLCAVHLDRWLAQPALLSPRQMGIVICLSKNRISLKFVGRIEGNQNQVKYSWERSYQPLAYHGSQTLRYLNSVFCGVFYAFYCWKQRKIVVLYHSNQQIGICNGIKFSRITICFNPVPLYNVMSVGRTELVNHFIFKRTTALLYHSGELSICFVATHKNFFIAKIFSLF